MFGVPFGTGVDLWSLGCILAEFFKGEPIFYGQNREEILEKVRFGVRSLQYGSEQPRLGM